MFNKFQSAAKYISYYLSAANGKGHGTHSPFIFSFITKVLNDKTAYPAYDKVEALRKKLLADETSLTVEDMGAGSSISKTNERTIASIARNAAKPRKYGQLLYRIAKTYQPATILELGTSLGITTSYLSLAQPAAQVITMEGATEVAAAAKRNLAGLGITNCRLIEGNFDHTLAAVLSKHSRIDLGFIDGNHRREPTESYFQQLLPHLHNDSILVFDDIHWSREMEDAWHTIKQQEAVRCSIDLFFIGIVFFRQEFKEKQEFTIRF